MAPAAWGCSPAPLRPEVAWVRPLTADFFLQGFQSTLRRSDSTWVRSRLWMTTERLPADWPPSSPPTMDSPPLDTTLAISSLSLCNKSQNRSSQAFSSSPLCPRFFKPFLLVSISDCR